MDFHLKQWRNQQHESEEEQQQPPSAKMPKLVMETHQQQNPSSSYSLTSTAPLPLFLPEYTCEFSHLSAFPDSTQVSPDASATTRSFPDIGGSYCSWAQWQELELKALIYRYMLAGAAVPPELLQPIKKNLLHSPPYLLHHPLQHHPYYQPAFGGQYSLSVLQTGYWGKAAMDPEPGRCRRTDGKKWRCSRDVMSGQKYCERHVHRGRNRSRKPVEIPTSTSSTNTTTSIGIGGGGGGGDVGGAASNSTLPPVAPPQAAVANETSFSLSGQSSSTEQLHLSNGSSDAKPEIEGLGPQNEVGNRSDGHILRHFFDDWPRSLQEPDDNAVSNASQLNSATCLSISVPGNSTSDVALKLSTGDGDEPEGHRVGGGREQPQVIWNGGWGTTQVASMGGPLAEALRSSASDLSPSSVLHLPRGSASETSYFST